MRFIDSWSIDDVYARFGAAGTDGRNRLAFELLQRCRSAFVAVHAGEVVGLLDYVHAHGAIHTGIVVDSRFRRLSIGTNLVLALLEAKTGHPVVAECQISNRPAIALLRACRFALVGIESPEMLWRAA